jgi:hypothetical protein
MGTPTVPFKVMPKGYRISGDVRTGYKATVPYFLLWSDAFTFADQIFGRTQATVVGNITWHLPYLFPAAVSRLYVQRFEIEPCGADGSTPLTYLGLAPGEYFTHAIVRVEFETPPLAQGFGDDPNNLHQLDPDNPLTMCKQSVKSAGKMETRKNGSYIYDDDSKPVPGDFAVPIAETKLRLEFPRVPYLPWELIQPYLNTVNSVAILNCPVGNLLLEDFDTEVTAGQDGLQQQLVLMFAVNHDSLDWNKLPKPDGTNVLVRIKADSGSGSPRRIYAYKDFTEIFNSITYVES